MTSKKKNGTESALTAARAPRRKSTTTSSAARSRKRVVPDSTDTILPQSVVTDDDIRIRAYFLSLEHRGSGMHEVDFWLLAERELKSAVSSTK